MTIRRNKSIESEFIISGTPAVTGSTASQIKTFSIVDSQFNKYVTSYVHVKNTGTSGSLLVAFEPGGFESSKYFTLGAGESFDKPVMTSVVYVSGAASQSYQICAAKTTVEEDKYINDYPLTIPDIKAWWNADSVTMVASGVADGRKISLVKNRVNSSSMNLSQSVAINQPEWVASSYYLNKRPAIKFVNPSWLATTLSGLGTEFTHFGVGYFTQPSTTIIGIYAQTISGVNASGHDLFHNGTAFSTRHVGGGTSGWTTYNMPNKYLYVITVNAQGTTGYFNSLTAQTFSSSPSATWNGLAPTMVDFFLGGIAIPQVRNWNGEIGEHGFINRKLTDSECQRIVGYLSQKYNVTLT